MNFSHPLDHVRFELSLFFFFFNILSFFLETNFLLSLSSYRNDSSHGKDISFQTLSDSAN